MTDARIDTYIFKSRFTGPLKVIAWITLWSFLFTTIGNDILIDKAWAARTSAEPSSVGSFGPGSSGLTIPRNLGEIKYRYDGIAKSAKDTLPRGMVIHIQDAHCNYYAQQKIKEIIEYFNAKYGVKTVNLEGGAGSYDLTPFTSIANKAIREKVSDHFVKEGLVNGAELFAINNPEKVTLWGVEDTDLYIENLMAYRESLKYKDEVDRVLRSLNLIFSNLKVRIYSAELLELESKCGQYKSGALPLKDYILYLTKKAEEKRLNIKSFPALYRLFQTIDIEKRIDFKKANIEREQLIDRMQRDLSRQETEELVLKTLEFKTEKISQKEFYAYLAGMAKVIGINITDFPELAKYVSYVSVYDDIDKSKIYEEAASLENRLKQSLYRNDEERHLSLLSKNLSLLKNIFDITLTQDEYKYYKDNEGAFSANSFTSFVNNEAPAHRITAKVDENISSLDQRRKAIEKFYEYSFKRDEAFVKNIKPGIIITGGFHTESLCAAFKKNNIPYISIIPNFKNEDGYECPYFKILSGEKDLNITQAIPSVLKTALAIPDPLNPEIIAAVRAHLVAEKAVKIAQQSNGANSRMSKEQSIPAGVATTEQLKNWSNPAVYGEVLEFLRYGFQYLPQECGINYRAKVKERDVLDVATGLGQLAVIAEENGAHEVTAIDIDDATLDVAKGKAHDRGYKTNFVKNDMRKMGFSDERFDVVTCGRALEFLSTADRRQALSEIFRVVKKNGLVMFMVYHDGVYVRPMLGGASYGQPQMVKKYTETWRDGYWSENAWKEELEQLGFRNIRWSWVWEDGIVSNVKMIYAEKPAAEPPGKPKLPGISSTVSMGGAGAIIPLLKYPVQWLTYGWRKLYMHYTAKSKEGYETGLSTSEIIMPIVAILFIAFAYLRFMHTDDHASFVYPSFASGTLPDKIDHWYFNDLITLPTVTFIVYLANWVVNLFNKLIYKFRSVKATVSREYSIFHNQGRAGFASSTSRGVLLFATAFFGLNELLSSQYDVMRHAYSVMKGTSLEGTGITDGADIIGILQRFSGTPSAADFFIFVTTGILSAFIISTILFHSLDTYRATMKDYIKSKVYREKEGFEHHRLEIEEAIPVAELIVEPTAEKAAKTESLKRPKLPDTSTTADFMGMRTIGLLLKYATEWVAYGWRTHRAVTAAVAILVLDHAVKLIINQFFLGGLDVHSTMPFEVTGKWDLGGGFGAQVINIYHGIDKSLLSRGSGLVIIFAGLFAITGLKYVLKKADSRNLKLKPERSIAAGLLLGGFASNAFDRYAFGGARDFLQIFTPEYASPLAGTYNLADIAMHVGAAVLIIIFFIAWGKSLWKKYQSSKATSAVTPPVETGRGSMATKRNEQFLVQVLTHLESPDNRTRTPAVEEAINIIKEFIANPVPLTELEQRRLDRCREDLRRPGTNKFEKYWACMRVASTINAAVKRNMPLQDLKKEVTRKVLELREAVEEQVRQNPRLLSLADFEADYRLMSAATDAAWPRRPEATPRQPDMVLPGLRIALKLMQDNIEHVMASAQRDALVKLDSALFGDINRAYHGDIIIQIVRLLDETVPAQSSRDKLIHDMLLFNSHYFSVPMAEMLRISNELKAASLPAYYGMGVVLKDSDSANDFADWLLKQGPAQSLIFERSLALESISPEKDPLECIPQDQLQKIGQLLDNYLERRGPAAPPGEGTVRGGFGGSDTLGRKVSLNIFKEKTPEGTISFGPTSPAHPNGRYEISGGKISMGDIDIAVRFANEITDIDGKPLDNDGIVIEDNKGKFYIIIRAGPKQNTVLMHELVECLGLQKGALDTIGTTEYAHRLAIVNQTLGDKDRLTEAELKTAETGFIPTQADTNWVMDKYGIAKGLDSLGLGEGLVVAAAGEREPKKQPVPDATAINTELENIYEGMRALPPEFKPDKMMGTRRFFEFKDGRWDWRQGNGLTALVGLPLEGSINRDLMAVIERLRAIGPEGRGLFLQTQDSLHITVAELVPNTTDVTYISDIDSDRQNRLDKTEAVARGFGATKAKFYYKDLTVNERGDIVALGYVEDSNLFRLREKLERAGASSKRTTIVHITIGRIFDENLTPAQFSRYKKLIEELREKKDGGGGPALLGEVIINELKMWDQRGTTPELRYGGSHQPILLHKPVAEPADAALGTEITSRILKTLGAPQNMQYRDAGRGFKVTECPASDLNEYSILTVFDIPEGAILDGDTFSVMTYQDKPVMLRITSKYGIAIDRDLSLYHTFTREERTVMRNDFYRIFPEKEISRYYLQSPVYINATFNWRGDVIGIKEAGLPIQSPMPQRTVEGASILIPMLPGVFVPYHSSSMISARAANRFAKPGMKVLVLGTGSGLEATIAALKGAEVTAVDMKAMAVENTKLTAELNGVGDKVSCAVLDLLDTLKDGHGQYDLVIFNMPHVQDVGDDGRAVFPGDRNVMDFNRRVLVRMPDFIRRHLAPAGTAVLVNTESQSIEKMLRGAFKEEKDYHVARPDFLGVDGESIAYIISKKPADAAPDEDEAYFRDVLEFVRSERYNDVHLVAGMTHPVFINTLIGWAAGDNKVLRKNAVVALGVVGSNDPMILAALDDAVKKDPDLADITDAVKRELTLNDSVIRGITEATGHGVNNLNRRYVELDDINLATFVQLYASFSMPLSADIERIVSLAERAHAGKEGLPVVLDVGAGKGLLAYLLARTGRVKVIATEGAGEVRLVRFRHDNLTFASDDITDPEVRKKYAGKIDLALNSWMPMGVDLTPSIEAVNAPVIVYIKDTGKDPYRYTGYIITAADLDADLGEELTNSYKPGESYHKLPMGAWQGYAIWDFGTGKKPDSYGAEYLVHVRKDADIGNLDIMALQGKEKYPYEEDLERLSDVAPTMENRTVPKPADARTTALAAMGKFLECARFKSDARVIFMPVDKDDGTTFAAARNFAIDALFKAYDNGDGFKNVHIVKYDGTREDLAAKYEAKLNEENSPLKTPGALAMAYIDKGAVTADEFDAHNNNSPGFKWVYEEMPGGVKAEEVLMHALLALAILDYVRNNSDDAHKRRLLEVIGGLIENAAALADNLNILFSSDFTLKIKRINIGEELRRKVLTMEALGKSA